MQMDSIAASVKHWMAKWASCASRSALREATSTESLSLVDYKQLITEGSMLHDDVETLFHPSINVQTHCANCDAVMELWNVAIHLQGTIGEGIGLLKKCTSSVVLIHCA